MSGACISLYQITKSMGKVEACTLPGYELFFTSNDHPPPHFHVEKPGHWVIRVKISWSRRKHGLKYDMIAPKHGHKRPSADEEALILEKVIRHRRALLREFRTKVNQDS